MIVNPADPESFLVRRVRIRIIPNALARNAPPPARRAFLAVADPIFNPADPRFPASARNSRSVVHASPASMGLPRLPGTAAEAAAASSSLLQSGYEARILQGGEISEESVLRQIAAFRPSIIHFATHSVSPAADADRIHLALSIRSDGSPGLLSAEDIASCSTNAELVVLSSCRSAAARSAGNAALLGLSRAWFRSGASRVLATLWPVADASKPLFDSFYASIAATPADQPLAAADALRAAQLGAIRRGGPQSEPAHWAGYVLLARR
jgi:CHAT domain-containing protein